MHFKQSRALLPDYYKMMQMQNKLCSHNQSKVNKNTRKCPIFSMKFNILGFYHIPSVIMQTLFSLASAKGSGKTKVSFQK